MESSHFLQTAVAFGYFSFQHGRLEDAERMYNRALAGYEKALGPEHTSTLRTVNNMGILYEHQGRLKDAERMFNREMAGKRKV